jgi:hypothetical protein
MKASKRHTLWSSCTALLAATAWAATSAAAPAVGDDIHDIRPLILIPSWWHWTVLAIAVGLALAAAAAAFRLWRRRSAQPLRPEQKARRALDRAEALAREGRSREWAEIVAPTLRAALSARIGQDACPQTTTELAAAPWLAPPHDVLVDAPRLLDLLSACDLTRFALARLDADSLVASTATARDWITRLFAAPDPASATPPQVTP